MSRERGVMSSEEADHVSPWEVTPTVGKGTLGTWWFPTSAWVAGLIKPVQSPDAVLETRLWANHGVRVYANQRLSLGEEGKAYGGKAKTSNRTGEIPPSGIIGGHGKRRHGGNENPSCNRKSRNGKPPPKAGRARALSQPQRKRGETDRLNLQSAAPVLDPTDERGWETGRRVASALAPILDSTCADCDLPGVVCFHRLVA